jgi:hypothetical protein
MGVGRLRTEGRRKYEEARYRRVRLKDGRAWQGGRDRRWKSTTRLISSPERSVVDGCPSSVSPSLLWPIPCVFNPVPLSTWFPTSGLGSPCPRASRPWHPLPMRSRSVVAPTRLRRWSSSPRLPTSHGWTDWMESRLDPTFPPRLSFPHTFTFWRLLRPLLVVGFR